MRPIRAAAAALTPQLKSLGRLLRRHHALTRVSLAALSFTLLVVLTQQATTHAGPEQQPVVRESLLPLTVGVAIATDASVTIPFSAPVDAASVEAGLELIPSQPAAYAWNDDRTALTISPASRWRTDERYVVVVPDSVGDGSATQVARRFSFTTQTAPQVTDFQVRLADDVATVLTPPADVGGADSLVVDADRAAKVAAVDASPGDPEQHTSQTATEVSATSAISVSFSGAMDADDVEDHFVISPAIAGDLSWRGRDLVFTPSERLVAGGRYTVSLIGAHDAAGNALGGKANFSFLVQPGAQLTTSAPEAGATDVEPATVEAWFSQPMQVELSGAAFSVTDTSTGEAVGGSVGWNETGTQLTFTPAASFPAGITFEVAFGDGAVDLDGNAVEMAWSFTTKLPPVEAAAPAAGAATPQPGSAAPAPPAAPAIPPAPPSDSAAGYAVNQINAARAAYGFGEVVLDDAISAVAYAHAYDQAVNGYLSHTGLDGSTRDSRLQAGGISYGWSGENQCYLEGRSTEATLDWCHGAFMAEPYPGGWNHIANVLDPRAQRVGVGIAQVGSRIVIVWNFTD